MSPGRNDVIIVGAGIGGLTAALTLASTGRRILVLERAAVLSDAGAGVQLSPNATRLLAGLGLLQRLREVATTPERLHIRRGRDARTLASVEMGSAAERRWGSPNLVLHRADLQRLLVEEVARHPAITVATGSDVIGFAAGADAVGVVARQGNAKVSFETEALVGADGLRSRVRQQLNPSARDVPTYSGRTAWRATIPTGRLDAMLRATETGLWLGSRAHLVHYPVRGGSALNVVAAVQDASGAALEGTSWNVAGDAQRLLARFATWAAPARELIAAAPEWRVWPLLERPPLRSWSGGRATLLGDAAHPLLPFLAQGAAQAIEDAVALGRAFERHGADVVGALHAYEQARIRRATAVQRQSRQQGLIYHLAGPMALARDAVMRRLGPERLVARYDWVYGDNPRPG